MLETLLFDLDGTLAHSDPIHFRAHRAALADHGLAIDEDFYARNISGMTNETLTARLLPHLTPEARHAYSMRKETLFRTEARQALVPVPGGARLIDRARAAGVRLALVTSAPEENAALMLDMLGFRDAFEIMVLAEELPRGKPDPLPFLTALKRLGVTPDAALAFEDSLSGVRSASGAGVFTIGIATGVSPQSLIEAGAGMAVADFNDPALWARLDPLLAGRRIA